MKFFMSVLAIGLGCIRSIILVLKIGFIEGNLYFENGGLTY